MELYRKELKLAVIKGLDESRGSSNVPIKLTHDTSDEYINYTEQIHIRYLFDNQLKEEILPTNDNGFYIPGKPLSHDGPIELAVHLINGDIELVTNELSFVVKNAPNGTTQVDPSEFTWQQLVDQYVNAKLETFADKADMNKFKDDVNANLSNQDKKITDQTTSINQTTSIQNSKITTLESRMDTFTRLSEGSTTGDAELQDIRVGANGITYDTAGNAVRGQYSQLKEDLTHYIYKPTLEDNNKFPRAKDCNIEWVEQGLPTDEQTSNAINNWLNAHPEATTTVSDNSLTINKMVIGTLGYVTPEMFGAVGDGVTDDVEPLETALNYSITNHLDLVLNKKYLVSHGIEIRKKNGIRIVGNAFGYYFDYETLPAIKCSESFNNDFLIKFDGCSDISIKGINFVGRDESRIIGIFIKDSKYSLIEDNNIIKFKKGIYLYYSGLNKIIRNTISICNCGCDAIGSGDSQYTDNYINSCSFTESPNEPDFSTGIAIRATSSHVNITGGKIEWNGKGIYIEGSSGINITSINFDYNKRGNIIINGNSMDPDYTETVGLNINSNYFRSGGVEGKESHIYFETNKGNIKANICGNTFVKASGNSTSDSTICPKAIIRHSSNISSPYKLNINVNGNMMLDGSTLNTFWLDGVNGDVNSYSNMTNKINYVINNELLVENSNLRKTVISQNVELTFNSDNNVYIGSLNVDLSNYKNGVVIPLGAVLQDDDRFCDYYVSYFNGTIHLMSAKHNTAHVSYCILYEQ